MVQPHPSVKFHVLDAAKRLEFDSRLWRSNKSLFQAGIFPIFFSSGLWEQSEQEAEEGQTLQLPWSLALLWLLLLPIRSTWK